MKLEIGNRVKVSPDITGLSEWIEGIIINIRNNPFLGKEVAIKDSLGRIFSAKRNILKRCKRCLLSVLIYLFLI